MPTWAEAFTAYARCARITRTLDATLALNPAAYAEPVEGALHSAYVDAAATVAAASEPAVVLGSVLTDLQQPINAYFERVLVNADDESLRQDAAAYARRVRRKTGLTQAAFAARIGVPIDTVRNWEQGKRSPAGPARALLRVLDRAPEAALAALD